MNSTENSADPDTSADNYKQMALFWTDILHLMSSKPQALASIGPMRAFAANSKKVTTELIEMNEDLVDFNKHLAEYYSQLADTWKDAQKKVNAKAPDVPHDVEQAEALKRIWVDIFDNDFTDLFDSSRFGSNYGLLVSKELELVRHWNNIANIILQSANLPSKKEIDEVYREIHSLKKRQRLAEVELQRLRRVQSHKTVRPDDCHDLSATTAYPPKPADNDNDHDHNHNNNSTVLSASNDTDTSGSTPAAQAEPADSMHAKSGNLAHATQEHSSLSSDIIQNPADVQDFTTATGDGKPFDTRSSRRKRRKMSQSGKTPPKPTVNTDSNTSQPDSAELMTRGGTSDDTSLQSASFSKSASSDNAYDTGKKHRHRHRGPRHRITSGYRQPQHFTRPAKKQQHVSTHSGKPHYSNRDTESSTPRHAAEDAD